MGQSSTGMPNAHYQARYIGECTQRRKVKTHKTSKEFKYEACRDMSAAAMGLNNSRVTRFDFEIKLVFADDRINEVFNKKKKFRKHNKKDDFQNLS